MRTLVIAPHADDELLGCGGTLLRRQNEGCEVAWLLVTSVEARFGWDEVKVEERKEEIRQVRKGLGIKSKNLFELGLEPTGLDQLPMNKLVQQFSKVISAFEPNELLIPWGHDIHSDHRVVFDAVSSSSKWFRYPSIKRIMSYETLSETDFILNQEGHFNPNFFIDISDFFEDKIKLLNVYKSEILPHPFPRSDASVRSLSVLRGSQSGFKHAEAFQLLRERN